MSACTSDLGDASHITCKHLTVIYSVFFGLFHFIILVDSIVHVRSFCIAGRLEILFTVTIIFRYLKAKLVYNWQLLMLQHRGPQRSVENVVSMAFVMTIVIISVLSIEVCTYSVCCAMAVCSLPCYQC